MVLFNNTESKKDFGREILGPIFYDFCARLHSYLCSHIKENSGGEPVVAYLARAGLRLRYLYDLYRQSNNAEFVVDEKDFYASRMSVAKGCLKNDFEYIVPIIVREYHNKTIGNLLRGVVNKDFVVPKKWENLEVTCESFKNIYSDSHKSSAVIREYFNRQSILLATYVKSCAGPKMSTFLVDSGWTGNTQAMLMRTYRDINWVGLYFGKWDYRRVHPSHFSSVVGLCLDGTTYDRRNPASCILHYHHLIEGPLEPNFPSTKEYVRNEITGEVEPDTLAASESAIAPGPRDGHFAGIVDYFHNQLSPSSQEVRQNAEKSYKKLSKLIRYPRKRDLSMMVVNDRSADFGRDEVKPVLIDPAPEGTSCIARLRRLDRSLWRQGQVVLEFPRSAWLIQRLVKFRPAV